MKEPEPCPLCNHDMDEFVAITGDPLGTRPVTVITSEVGNDA